MSESLEHYAPKWAVKQICKKKCNTCSHQFVRSDIIQIGIRKIKKENEFMGALAIEAICPVCEKISVITFSQYQDFRELLCILLEEMQKIDKIKKSQQFTKEHTELIPKSKISEKEIKEFKKKLNQIDNYQDFLKELGIEENDES